MIARRKCKEPISQVLEFCKEKGRAAGAAPPGDVLLRVDLEGHAQVVWQHKGLTDFSSELTRGIPSPDGRYLAVSAYTNDSNVWMLEKF